MPLSAREKLQLLQRRHGAVGPREEDSFLSRAVGDIIPTFKEEASGFADILTSPIQAGKGLLNTIGAASDLNLGTDFVDEEAEQGAIAAKDLYVDQVKDWENRPIRALANLSIFAPGAGLIKGAATAGKLGRLARVAGTVEKGLNLADPLTLTAKAGGKVAGAGGRAATKVAQGANSISGGNLGFFKEYATNFFGLINSRGANAMQQMWEMMKDPAARREALRVSRLGDLGEVESAFIATTDKFVDLKETAYRSGIDELKKNDGWLTPVTDDTGGLIADIFTDAFNHEKYPIGGKVRRVKVKEVVDEVPTVAPDFLQRDGGVGDIIEEVPDEFTYKIDFDDSQIGDSSKRTINQAFTRAQNWAKEHPNATQRDLDGFKKILSDEIESMGLNPDGVTGTTKRALINIKNSYRKKLHEDTRYAQVMDDYSNASTLMDEIEEFLEFDFRESSINRTSPGEAPRQKHLLNRLGRVFESDDANAGKRLEVMNKLKDVTGDENLLSRQMGVEFSPFLGGGLVGRSEMSQGGRRLLSAVQGLGGIGVGVGAAAVTGSALAAVAAIPAFIILSPRATLHTAAFLMEHGMGANQAKKVAEKVGDDGDKWRSLLKSRGINSSEILQKMKSSGTTVADLVQQAAKGARRPAQANQRLTEEEDNPKPKNIFRTLGR